MDGGISVKINGLLTAINFDFNFSYPHNYSCFSVPPQTRFQHISSWFCQLRSIC